MLQILLQFHNTEMPGLDILQISHFRERKIANDNYTYGRNIISAAIHLIINNNECIVTTPVNEHH